MFKKIESNPEAYEEFTGNMKGTRFFSEYDIFGVNLKKYTDGCLAGKYKMTLIVWVGTSPLTSY